jgi:SAM-dependent methyltransferase
MLVKERLSIGQWVPPWLRHQHEARYDWAARQVEGGIVLDAACGNGYGSDALARGGARRVFGFDLSFDPLVEGRTAGRDPRARFGCASVTAQPFRDATFDVFVSLETIEHVEDDAAYVAEARRVLKSEGVLICSTPNRRVLNPGATLRDRPFNRFHMREYAAGELEALLRTWFRRVKLFGQSCYAQRYVSLLGRIGARVPMLAVRLHQMRKVAGIPRERRERHEPRELPIEGSEPEVLIAVCSDRSEP